MHWEVVTFVKEVVTMQRSVNNMVQLVEGI
jgi:hypothetical protein